jgi:hypothetical protein
MSLFKNFAITRVLTAPTPPTTGTSLVVNTGKGSLFPSGVPFRAVVWPVGEMPLSTNAEIVYVSSRTGDAFTIQRQQEGSISRTIQVGDQIAETITAETVRDLRNVNRIVVDDNYVLNRTDDLVVCNKTGDMTLTLVPATGYGKIIQVKNINTGIVTIDPDGTDTIEDEVSFDLYQGESLVIVDYVSGKWTAV